MQIILKKWRRINPYVCRMCSKNRYSFKYTKAHEKICSKCQKLLPDENQIKLF